MSEIIRLRPLERRRVISQPKDGRVSRARKMAAEDWGTDHIDGELGSDTAVTRDVFAPMSLPLFQGLRFGPAATWFWWTCMVAVQQRVFQPSIIEGHIARTDCVKSCASRRDKNSAHSERKRCNICICCCRMCRMHLRTSLRCWTC